MEYIQIVKGKKKQFTFVNKKAEQEYILVCELTFGGVPYEVNWAIGTEVYNKTKAKLEGMGS